MLLLALILELPGLINYVTTHDWKQTMGAFNISGYWLAPMLAVYLVNFYLLVPLVWFKRKRWQFFVFNVALIIAFNSHIVFRDQETLPELYRIGYTSFIIISLIVNCMAIGIAMSIRYVMRQQERRQQEVEAELAWLKNQINPHFLFNTLNNISSLVQIDGDEAQEAIMQLSDLLRYAMYETGQAKVPISGEVEFMRNYIELMKLRCNGMTTVDYQFSIVNYQLEIAPLLFISLVENAFKHGMNSNAPASIHISLTEDDKGLTFVCDNTNNPKPTSDRSGSGIGLENTRRRLDLLYNGRYKWEQTITQAGIYHVKITLEL